MTINDYNHCVDEYSDSVFRFLLKNTGDAETARELVQESFMKMWIKRKEVQSEKAKSYLFTTAYHTMIDGLRKSGRMTRMEGDENKTESVDHGYSDLKEVLEEALTRLPEIQRSVVLLRDYEGYSYEEIGGTTGLSEAQVKVYIYRARVGLKKYLVSAETVL